MAREGDVSRRAFLAGIAALAAASRASRVDGGPANLPVITKRVEKLYKIAGCRQPNDLQFVADGLWVLDQVDPNKAFRVRPADGSVIQELQTESIHGSGITCGNGALWIASTKMTDPLVSPRTLKVDAMTGKTLKSWVTPGSGLYGKITATSTSSGAHGLKWVDGRYWMAVPASGKLFLMEPETRGWQAPRQDPVDEGRSRAPRARHQRRRSLVLRRSEQLDLPATLGACLSNRNTLLGARFGITRTGS